MSAVYKRGHAQQQQQSLSGKQAERQSSVNDWQLMRLITLMHALFDYMM